jgi:hypothetical protein
MASISKTRDRCPVVVGILALVLLSPPLPLRAQVENVPAGHAVYYFLERMETRGVLGRYHDAILPLSRKEVSSLLAEAAAKDSVLSPVEREYLDEFLREFSFDLTGDIRHARSLVDPPEPPGFSVDGHLFSDQEKYLFAGWDSTVSLFASALVALDARGIAGDALGDRNAQFIQFGGRFRGTAFGRLGYDLQGTNAAFTGSRELLQRDRILSQAHTLGVLDTKHFDFAEGYVRYADDLFSLQIGRERILWGTGVDQKMVASDNVRVFDFIRAGARYKGLQYTFLHGWLLGEPTTILYSIAGDTTAYTEPVNADKYFAGHRFEVSFQNALDVGFQEMVIYSNRSPDLAYLNPLILIESVQRSRGERDNVYWAFDVETHFLSGLQLTGSMLFDDLHLGEFFEPRWYNRYAYQAGMVLTDPLFVPNVGLAVEYTRVEPFVFSHNRSRENSYSSLGAILGPRIGPNADSWYVRFDWIPARRWFVMGAVSFERRGENVYDESGNLVRNVGGDYRQPHRPDDPVDRVFLDGNLMKTTRGEILVTCEIINQLWVDGWYLFEMVRDVNADTEDRNQTGGIRLRMEF